jgi:hypothetical protein
MRIAVPGPHPILATPLRAGFQITYVETFVSTVVEPFTDVEHYLPSGGLF